eukprot:Sspe_Gene.69177::Locus_40776_Transcript_2_3_Confidence_0.333_Length_645::g.69177::m.69177
MRRLPLGHQLRWCSTSRPPRLAVLIDAERSALKPTDLRQLQPHLSKLGTPDVLRVYGDWSSMRLNAWLRAAAETGYYPVSVASQREEKPAPTHIEITMDIIELAAQPAGDLNLLVSSAIASSFAPLAHLLPPHAKLWVVGSSPSPLVGALNPANGEAIPPSALSRAPPPCDTTASTQP